MINFTVGPVQSSDVVRAIGGEQVPYFRTAEFSDVMLENELVNVPVLAMSNLTRALISAANPDIIRSRRLANFSYLANRLKTEFPLNPLPGEVPLAFPYVTHDPTLRQRLIDAQIFVATYWPGCEHSDSLVNTILPLPIDQRYDLGDVDYILETIGR